MPLAYRTRIYTRNVKGDLQKFDVEGKITHQQAKQLLKIEGIGTKGAILLTHNKIV